jgi:hypothetical protein
MGAAGSLRRSFSGAALETAVETKPRSRLGKLVAATAVGHYRLFSP